MIGGRECDGGLTQPTPGAERRCAVPPSSKHLMVKKGAATAEDPR